MVFEVPASFVIKALVKDFDAKEPEIPVVDTKISVKIYLETPLK